MIPTHRAIARNGIFYRTRKNVAIMRKAGGKRRTIIKNKLPLGGFFFKGLLEDIVLFPKCEDFLFIASYLTFFLFIRCFLFFFLFFLFSKGISKKKKKKKKKSQKARDEEKILAFWEENNI